MMSGYPPYPPARLVVTGGRANVAYVDLSPAGVISGRDPTGTLVLADAQVSRQHARLDLMGSQWVLTDMNSANGTFVNGTRISRHALVPGDRIQLGQVVLMFQAGADVQAATVRGPMPGTGPYAPPPGPPGVTSPYPPGAVYVAPSGPPAPAGGYGPPAAAGPYGYAPAQPPPPAAAPYAPAGQYAPPPAAPPRKKRGCGRWLALGCLVVIVLLLAAAAAGYYAYRQGLLTVDNLLNLVGFGPGYVEVDNFRDDTIHVSIQPVEPSEEAYSYAGNLETMDVATYSVNPVGRYRVGFGSSSGGAELGTCNLTIEAGDEYQFVALPNQMLINRVKPPVTAGTDLIVSSSSLCR